MDFNERSNVSFAGDTSKRFDDSRFGDSRFMVTTSSASLMLGKPQKARRSTLIITVGALLVTASFIILAFLLKHEGHEASVEVDLKCSDSCKFVLAETLPDQLEYPKQSFKAPKIVDYLMKMVASANKSIDIASSYWTLKASDVKGGPYAEATVGEALYNALVEAVIKRGVSLRIVQQVLDGSSTQSDTLELAKLPNVAVRTLNMSRYFESGITHTKMWIVDGQILYVGSANTDWRSYTVVKELGTIIENCTCAANDASKIFGVFWTLADGGGKLPKIWPAAFQTKYNKDNPIIAVDSSNISTKLYITTSPIELCPSKRTSDIDGLLHVIATAKSFVNIAVMDYAAATFFQKSNRYWGEIDNALRNVGYNKKITVRLLASSWAHTDKKQLYFLKSLQDFSNATKGGIQVKLFTFPPCQKGIPYSCVNHNKYMVTDNAAFISTSNWQGDYFIDTTGVSVIYNASQGYSNDIVDKAQKVFMRDWESSYAMPIS